MAITKIFEIIDKGRGIIEELTPENLLLLKEGGSQTLSETLDNGNVTGGFNIVINDADAIELENTSLLKKGTYDFGGDGGISRICSVGFEDMWQSGFRHVFDNNGLIRHSTNCFDVIPDETFDDTLRFKIDSLWTLDNGTTYKCLDASTGAAIWELYSVGGIPTLQEVLDNNHDLVDGIFNVGTDSGLGNTGTNQNALGERAGKNNSGTNQNALGQLTGAGNTGNDVNALGYEAGIYNTFNNVNLFGKNAQPDEDGQTVFSKDGTIMARISTADLTDTHKYNLPDADGTIALTSDIPSAVTPTLQEVLTEGNTTDLTAIFEDTYNKTVVLTEGVTTELVGEYKNILTYAGFIFEDLTTLKSTYLQYNLPTGVGVINIPDVGASSETLALLSDIPSKTSDLINDGEDGTSPYVTANQLPSNLNLFATNVSSDIATYFKLVTSIDDPDYNDTAVDIPTGAITTTGQFIAALATTANVLVGNPGIINLLTIGNVRRTSGTGTAEFYYEVYHRTSGGTETLIATSSNTPPVSAAIYTEFLAAALLNNGVFLATDRIVIKYYADRIGSGSNPNYDFQFGGTSPVRTTFPVPASNIPLDAIPTDGSTNGVQSNGVFDALALKADSANVEQIFDAKGYGNWGQANNSTAEEVLRVIDVPAGYYTPTDSMSLLIRLQKGSNTGNMTLAVRVGINGNTSDNLILTTTVTAGGNSPSILMQRNQIVFDASNLYIPSTAQSLNTDITSGAYGSYSAVSLNISNNWKITITCKTDSNTQNIILRHYKITKFKNT